MYGETEDTLRQFKDFEERVTHVVGTQQLDTICTTFEPRNFESWTPSKRQEFLDVQKYILQSVALSNNSPPGALQEIAEACRLKVVFAQYLELSRLNGVEPTSSELLLLDLRADSIECYRSTSSRRVVLSTKNGQAAVIKPMPHGQLYSLDEACP